MEFAADTKMAGERTSPQQMHDAAGALNLPRPYLVFLGSESNFGYAKSSFGLRDWAPQDCVGELSYGDSGITLGLPQMQPEEARENGARALVIGVAKPGGAILDEWIPHLVAAMQAGLHVVSGTHTRLGDVPELARTAETCGVRLIDIRRPPPNIPTGSGLKRTGKRLLTVGTDCALGKKYTALAIARGFKARGLNVDFRATGQTGILIAGGGIPMDAVVSDFEAGAAEMLSPDAAPDHWDIVEGQGSILHPAFAAVSAGLLFGTQPDIIIVCHDPSRTHILGHPHQPIPGIDDIIEISSLLGKRVNPDLRCAGISLNTKDYSEAEAEMLMQETARRHNLPVADPMRGGERLEALLDNCLV